MTDIRSLEHTLLDNLPWYRAFSDFRPPTHLCKYSPAKDRPITVTSGSAQHIS